MSIENEPLIRLEPGGKASIVSYSLPEPAIYYGRNFVKLPYEDGVFIATAREAPPSNVRQPLAEIAGADINTLEAAVRNSMRTGFADRRMFPTARLAAGARIMETPSTGLMEVTAMPQRGPSRSIDVTEVAANLQAGKRLNLYTSMFGTPRHNYPAEPVVPIPTILLVETYRLASYLGTYGAGRVVKTFSLLPGERTKISVRSFLKSEQERKSASSILDSFTEESASDFEETIASEQSDKQTYDENFSYYLDAEAKASWGWGSAEVKAGLKGGTNSAREEFAKNTANATTKHAQKASAKRDVQINTSHEVRQTAEEESAIEREIENTNLSRTLNFVFRQMNQAFVTILSLVDMRVAFFNGFPETRREVPLSQVESLLEEFIVPDQRALVRQQIGDALGSILDFQGNLQTDFVEKRQIEGGDEYLRVRSERTSTFEDALTGLTVEVPGIILSATKNVMRTEGVIVEALLGVGGALDGYATQLQELEVERRRAAVHLEAAMAERASLLNQLVRENDTERAKLLVELTSGSVAARSGVEINLTNTPDAKTSHEPA